MLSYDSAGTGPALVLLHSTVCDRRMWDPQWPVFVDAGYRAVRCDFRGFGQTPVPQGVYNDADDVVGLLEPAREQVRLMQRHAFDVQLAAPEEDEPIEVAVELSAITAPSLVVSGAKDLPDFRQIAARLAAVLPFGRAAFCDVVLTATARSAGQGVHIT